MHTYTHISGPKCLAMQVKIQPSLRMGTFLLLLLLFTSEGVCAEFIIKSVMLKIQPKNDVQRGTNVTLTCLADVSHGQGSHPSYTYMFYKDYQPLRTENTSETELLYSIPDARVGHSGKYECAVTIEGQKKDSGSKDLTVKGLQTPVLEVDKLFVREGDDVTANCTAEGETGVLTFFFRDGQDEIFRQTTSSHQVTRKLFLTKRKADLFCYYSVNLGGTTIQSNNSNKVIVNIQELEIKPSIIIRPIKDIIEGDTITIHCSADMTQQRNPELKISLVHGRTTLSVNMAQEDYTIAALANTSGEYECISSMGFIHKSSSQNITVKELFSKPVLNINSTEVFEGEDFTISCKIDSFASERIRRNDIKYSIYRDSTPVAKDGEYHNTASTATNGNYMCKAQANGIIKESQTMPFRAKVLVSKPEITVDSPVIVGKPFRIHCRSQNGSLPIMYSLKRNHFILNQTTVYHYEAQFWATISDPGDIGNYWCEAKNNGPFSAKKSERLYAPVIVPVGKPLLTVLPVPDNIEEGNDVTLICGISKGSPPITFRFYRSSHTELNTNTVQSNSSSYVLKAVSKGHSGTYFCEAFNKAKESSRSDPITFAVSLAMWKTVLIAVFCILLVVLLVLFFVMRQKAKRGKRETAAELSVKPASPKSDETLALSLIHDTHYSAHTVGVNNKESVWSERPPEISDEGSVESPNEGDVEYTEVVHPHSVDPERIPLRKGTDTVYSELQTSPGAPEHMNHQGMVEYAELNHDLPEPVD